ncbi:TIGR02757 family protein [Athalassotoga saccharophila]|uniref:TIGR02757 family protein n=1 Tax=Athalassotoga saccharophila TaxID=1441386 RepID=UPI00137B1FAF|nr:TIGR02757 family protein [Athalassotoga saccharophila]BBJ27307.1 hypothetical protein ATHSA_0175 [Athalassotoga saccharophila]
MLKKDLLESLYARYNKYEYIHPDPLEFLYNYPDIRDREIVGLIAASLAYGRVSQILKDVSFVLDKMERPYEFIMNSDREYFENKFEGFIHRYTDVKELTQFLMNLKSILQRFGSIHDAFKSGMKIKDENVIPALSNFIRLIVPDGKKNTLVPSAECKSPCKRLNLFLRWMVRHDEVDPGGWDDIPPSKLIVPLDTHMHHISLVLGLTSRKQADMKAAYEITENFKAISPEDPVKYDFCLTRLGIRDDTDMNAFFKEYENA